MPSIVLCNMPTGTRLRCWRANNSSKFVGLRKCDQGLHHRRTPCSSPRATAPRASTRGSKRKAAQAAQKQITKMTKRGYDMTAKELMLYDSDNSVPGLTDSLRHQRL